MYDLYSDFNLELHKQHYINYLAVVVLPDGEVKYAVPSHQEFLLRYGADQRGISVKEFENLCPKEYYLNFLYWLAMQIDCVLVWSQGYFGIDLTEAQKDVLSEFVAHGLMRDTILKV